MNFHDTSLMQQIKNILSLLGKTLIRHWRFSLLGLVALIVFIFFLGSSQSETTPSTVKKKSIRVETWTAVPMLLKDILTLPGTTEALHDVTVAAERSGRVEWIGTTEGELVQQDDLLIRIDLENALADLNKARSAYNLAKIQAERRDELFAQKVLSEEEMDKANTELEAARSSLSQAQKAYNQGKVTSPVTGMINEIFVDPGEWVNTGQAVAEIINSSAIKININVPEMDVRYLHKNQNVQVTVDAYPEENWQGVVDFVAFKADENTKTFKVQVLVENNDLRIRPGMLARVTLERQNIQDAITVPLYAIINKGGERSLFVAKNGQAHSKSIQIGIITGDRVQVVSGLKRGEKVIVSGHTEVAEGVAIDIVGELTQ